MRDGCGVVNVWVVCLTGPRYQFWQAFETPTGQKTSQEIEFEEVVEKRRPLGRFRPDRTFDDEDNEAKAKQIRLATLRLIWISSTIAAVYMLLHLPFLWT